jgi:hypothetical protein
VGREEAVAARGPDDAIHGLNNSIQCSLMWYCSLFLFSLNGPSLLRANARSFVHQTKRRPWRLTITFKIETPLFN